jgi:hypothetical protein
MEKPEQCVVIKFLWMKGFGARGIHIKLSRVPSDDSYDIAATQRWLSRFRGAIFHASVILDQIAQ